MKTYKDNKTPFKEKIEECKQKIIELIHNKQYVKHLYIITGIVVGAAIVVSIAAAGKITANDIVIKYTVPIIEEIDMEGLGENTETAVEEPVPEETPVPEEPVPEETPVPEEPVPEETPVPEEPVPEEPVSEETPEPEEEPVPEETPALEEATPEETTVGEIIAEEPSLEETATEAETMSFIPEVQIKSKIVSTMRRPWILSDLSDMFHNLR